MKRWIIFLAVTLFAIAFTFVGNRMSVIDTGSGDEMVFYPARILSVEAPVVETILLDDGVSTIENRRIPFKAEFTGGPEKGEAFEGIQYFDSMYVAEPREIQPGDRILATYDESAAAYGSGWVYVEHNRSTTLIYLTLAFFVLIVLIGRSKGLATIMALAFTAAAIFLVYIPSILKGVNVYAATIVICIYIILVSLIIMNGLDRKTVCAILGNIGGVAVAGALAYFMNGVLDITGIIDEDYVMLTFLETSAPIDLRAVIWGSIVIGSLGAIMDVAMSIASAMNELAAHMEKKTFLRMLRSGMNIGIDSIGTMTSTLVLAYMGGSLAMVLLLVAYNKNVFYLFNLEMIVVEVVQAVIGSMGILFAVPATALIAAYIFNRGCDDCRS